MLLTEPRHWRGLGAHAEGRAHAKGPRDRAKYRPPEEGAAATVRAASRPIARSSSGCGPDPGKPLIRVNFGFKGMRVAPEVVQNLHPWA